MEYSINPPSERKFIVTMFLAAFVIASILALMYFDLRTRYENLVKEYQDLKSRLGGRPTVSPAEIYNRTKDSIVLVRSMYNTSHGLNTKCTASGFIYDENGHIITNYHVIENASEIRVTFTNGVTTNATLLAFDVYTDLAVLKVTAKTPLHPLSIGDSDQLRVGDYVYAIGNSQRLLSSLAIGHINSLSLKLLLETTFEGTPVNITLFHLMGFDATVDTEYSGGALLNTVGEAVGMIMLKETAGLTNIRFAIPSNVIKRVVPRLISEGNYSHPWIGIMGMSVNSSLASVLGINYTAGFLITEVVPDSPAEEAQLRGGNQTISFEGKDILIGGDIIVEIDGISITGENDILLYLEKYKEPGDMVELRIVRDGELWDHPIFLRLGEKPSPLMVPPKSI